MTPFKAIRALVLSALLGLAPGNAFADHAAPPEDGFVLAQWGNWSVETGVAAIEDAHRVGARHVAIMIQLCQLGKNASEVHWCDAEGMPFEVTDLGLKTARLVNEIHARGMSFSLLPIIFSGPDHNRQWIWPDDRAAWFASYGDRMVELARFSDARGAPSFVVGSELTLLFVEAAGWRQVISRVRAVYAGHLTISPVFMQFPLIGFWDALDSIGISAYFPLTASDRRLSQQWLLNTAWNTIKMDLDAFAIMHGKPLMFVEVGYPTTDVAASQPWDYTWGSRALDYELPRRCWEAFRNAWSHSKRLRAFQIWALSSPAEAAASPKIFSPLHKPAEAVVEQLFRERAGI